MPHPSNSPDDPAGAPTDPEALAEQERVNRNTQLVATVGVLGLVALVIAVLYFTVVDDDDDEVADPAVPTTVAPAPGTADPGGEPPDDPALPGPGREIGQLAPERSAPPGQIAAVTADGRLVLIDTESGDETADLAFEGDLRDDSVEGGPMGIDGVALTEDGSSVWYSTCCEPAAGMLYQIGTVPNGEAVLMGNGYRPRIGVNTDWVTSIGYVVRLDRLDDASTVFWQPPEGGASAASLSPQGDLLVVQEWPDTPDGDRGSLLLVSTTDRQASANANAEIVDTDPVAVPGDRWAWPTFRRDGTFVAAQGPESLGEEWTTWVIDPVSLATEQLDIEYSGVPLGHDIDASGEWLLVVVGESDQARTGRLMWFGPDGESGSIDGEFSIASW